MNFYDQIEFESNVFTSLWLTQKALKRKTQQNSYLQKISELDIVLKNPNVYVFRNDRNIKFFRYQKYLVNGGHTGRIIPNAEKSPLTNCSKTPFAFVCFLQPCKRGDRCQLTSNDRALVERHKAIFSQYSNVVYVIRRSRHVKHCDVAVLEVLSNEIYGIIYGKQQTRRPNSIYCRLFQIDDEQIPDRIGLYIYRSIICHLQSAHKKTQALINAIKDKQQLLEEVIQMDHSVFRSLKTYPRTFKYFENQFLDSVVTACKETLLEAKFMKVDAHKSQKESSILSDQQRVPLEPVINLPRRRKATQSCRDPLRFRNQTNIKKRKRGLRRSTNHKHITLPSFDITLKGVKSTNNALKDVLANLKDVLSTYVSFDTMVVDKFTCVENCVYLHEWKTVSERNTLVSGFGYVDGQIEIYLQSKDDLKSSKKSLSTYLKKFVDIKRYKVNALFKDCKILPYSSIEQGSKIFPAANTDHFGTLGMFLTDKSGNYFFTTCAHVIGKNESAYSFHNKMKIGENVDTYEPDFSLVRVSPETNIECELGLKASNGEFIKGDIFRGDITEIVHQHIYKWGATEPYLQECTCVGSGRDGNYYFLVVDAENFAMPGDSGSIICIGEDIETSLAAFVLTGKVIEREGNRRTKEYSVYKISNAIDEVIRSGRDIIPCLLQDKKTVTITTAEVVDQPLHVTSRSSHKVLPPRRRRRSPHK